MNNPCDDANWLVGGQQIFARPPFVSFFLSSLTMLSLSPDKVKEKGVDHKPLLACHFFGAQHIVVEGSAERQTINNKNSL